MRNQYQYWSTPINRAQGIERIACDCARRGRRARAIACCFSTELPIHRGMDALAIRREVAERAREVILAVLPWVAVIYASLGTVYLVAPPLTPGWPYVATASAAAILMLGLRSLARHTPARGIHVVAFAAALVGLTHALSFLVLTRDPAQTVVLVIVLIGASFDLLAYWSAFGLLLVGLSAWLVLAWDFPPAVFAHWSVNVGGAIAIASVMAAARIRSVREQIVADYELRHARDAAETAARVKSDFLATMSHEIRTPLNGIFGMTELALDTTDNSERREFLLRARACTKTLMSILNDVLDFSRVEAGRVEPEQIELDARDVVRSVVDALSPEADRKGLVLTGRVDEEMPLVVIGDPGRLRQILMNLGSNALKFTERGEVVVHLGLQGGGGEGAAGDASTVLLRGSVRDTGIGIARQQQRSIFDAFTQADSSTTRRFGGTGLGLAISQRLVTLMQGSIGVESEPGQGSTFWFTVRCGVAPAPVIQLEEARTG